MDHYQLPRRTSVYRSGLYPPHYVRAARCCATAHRLRYTTFHPFTVYRPCLPTFYTYPAVPYTTFYARTVYTLYYTTPPPSRVRFLPLPPSFTYIIAVGRPRYALPATPLTMPLPFVPVARLRAFPRYNAGSPLRIHVPLPGYFGLAFTFPVAGRFIQCWLRCRFTTLPFAPNITTCPSCPYPALHAPTFPRCFARCTPPPHTLRFACRTTALHAALPTRLDTRCGRVDRFGSAVAVTSTRVLPRRATALIYTYSTKHRGSKPTEHTLPRAFGLRVCLYLHTPFSAVTRYTPHTHTAHTRHRYIYTTIYLAGATFYRFTLYYLRLSMPDTFPRRRSYTRSTARWFNAVCHLWTADAGRRYRCRCDIYELTPGRTRWFERICADTVCCTRPVCCCGLRGSPHLHATVPIYRLLPRSTAAARTHFPPLHAA